MIKSARNKKATEFKTTFGNELASRVAEKLGSMKQNIAKTMFAKESTNVEESSGDKEAYQKFFQGLLKKFGVKSPAELDDNKKKAFYDAIDKGWKSDKESD